uniref:Ribonucleoside-diphosphate reductase n=1 Tax=Timema monikensis TaxID=170555 RepID=A0A7R9E906_9NEOP|nr:unnamed protein product [Timema monikensis]
MVRDSLKVTEISDKMFVFKRDGRREEVHFDKITSRIQKLCYGLSKDFVDPPSITLKVISGLYSGVTTVELDNLAAETAATMTTKHPDYAVLAARIAVSNLHKETKKTFSDVMEDLYKMVDKVTGKLSPMISDYHYDIIKRNAERLNSSIIYDRDFNYNYFGFKTLERSYLLRIDGEVVERPQHMLMRVAVGIHGEDIDSAIETYNLLSERYFTHASPTLFGAATPKPQMSSCFLLTMKDDSIEGIYDTLKQCALISKSAGGIGLNIHCIRATGSYIAGTNGTSNGIVPMLRVYNNTARYVDQGGNKEHLKSVTDNEVCSLLNLGTCGLHVVHGSLRTGVESVDWDISSLLRHMYYLFTDSPARRALFTQLTGCTTFPLKFCGVRWLENAKCFQRALQIWDHVIKFLKEAKLPKTKPVETLKRAACDPFLKCKLAFCKTIADECQPFLQRFQTSKPMTPYLFEAVEKLLRYLMNRCVKPDLMKCTGPKLLSIDTKKSENLILSKNIDIGFATKRLLGETAITVTERQKLEFIHECRSMLTTMIAKLQEKSPLKQKAVRGLSSLDPCVIQHSPQLAQKRFSFLLEELNHANIINDVLAENAKKEYLHFCNLKKSELQEIFRPCDQFSDEVGLDTIYGSFLIGEANYKHLWEVIKICLVLSHGNATVEGGFSVNKSLLVENMHEKTVIAQRHIHDEIQEAGGIKNIHISKKMLDYVRGARKRYHEYLEMKKQEKSEKDKKKAEKRKLDIQVKDLEGERKKLMMATEEKREAIDVELQELKKKQASLY